MTSIENVLRLLDAGYSKDEINALLAGNKDGQPPKASQEDPETTNDQQTETAPAPAAPVTDDTAKALAELTAQVHTLVKAQQAANRANTSNMQRVTASTDEILAGLINPKTGGN